MSKTERVIAYIMQQLSLIGENFGWQMGRIGANYENGYMKCNQDSKAHFRKDKIKQDIEEMLREDHIVEPNKMIDQFREDTKKVVTNADRIRNMSDEELFELLRKTKYCPPVMCKKINGYHISCKECIGKWLKEKVE